MHRPAGCSLRHVPARRSSQRQRQRRPGDCCHDHPPFRLIRSRRSLTTRRVSVTATSYQRVSSLRIQVVHRPRKLRPHAASKYNSFTRKLQAEVIVYRRLCVTTVDWSARLGAWSALYTPFTSPLPASLFRRSSRFFRRSAQNVGVQLL